MLDGTEFLECACGSDEHTLRFTLSLDEEPEIYTSVFLGSYPWGWQRLWTAIKYLFGYKCKYGHWDCFNMKPEDADRLRAMLDRLSPPKEPRQFVPMGQNGEALKPVCAECMQPLPQEAKP